MSYTIGRDKPFNLSGDIYKDMLLYLAYEAHRDEPEDRWLTGRFQGQLTMYQCITRMSSVYIKGNLLAHYTLIKAASDKQLELDLAE